jgi:hypothetical protein
MLESFLNPGYLAAGAALVSLPIIIHLINRMRFRRVRWAAMEFLLRSQRRNRRRLIIEQLLLLALRCLLILLAVVLVSRYLGFSWAVFEPQNTLHVVVLDDTLSMTDQWKEEGESRDAFRMAKESVLKEIARNAAQARTAQRLVLLTLSEPGTVRFDGRLNDQSVGELQNVLADAHPTALHVDPAKGVEAAKEILDKVPQDRRILHLVSDFRRPDWAEPNSAHLVQRLDELGRAGVQIYLVDVAHPYRSDVQKTPLYHDNLAIVDLRPETRLAAKDMPVQFTVTVANYGVSESKPVRVTVKVNGGERLEGSVNLLKVQPGIPMSAVFQISFDQLGYNQVSANLENEEVGLQGDNIRYAVVQVRKQVPILLIDGDPAGSRSGGDSFHLQAVFSSAKGFQVVSRAVNELEQPALDQYAAIYLLNVRELSDKGLRNLENFVRDGGGLAIFLGDHVNPDYYTKKLYAGGKGLFPAPLADRPFPPVSEPEMDPNLIDGQFKLFVRDETNPIFADVWQQPYRTYFKFLPIKRYYPVALRGWDRTPGRVQELATLPNRRPLQDYAITVQELLDALNAPIQDPQCARYRPDLERHQQTIRELLGGGNHTLPELATALEALLNDRGQGDDPNRPGLAQFWERPESQKLRARVEQLRQTVQFGDPLVLAETFGKGRVVAFLTTAGQAWNNWAGGSPAAATFPAVILELQKYLTTGGGDANRIVGNPLALEVDGSRYDARLRCFYRPEARENAGAAGGPDAGPALVDLGEILGTTSGGRVSFLFQGTQKYGPGLYLFDLNRLGEEGNPSGAAHTEQRAYVFNVDPAESDLRRAPRDELERAATGVRVRNPGTGWGTELANRQNDLSESPWFYLLFLAILVAEQALAVRLSYHLKGGETAAVPVGRPQASAA